MAYAADVEATGGPPRNAIGLNFGYNLERDRTHEADIWLTYEQPTQADFIASKLAHDFISLCMRARATSIAMAFHQRWTRLKSSGCGACQSVRSELLDVLIGTERPQGFIAMRTNSSLSQHWSVTGGGIGALPTFVSEITSAAALVPLELRIRRELRLGYRSKAKPSPAILAAVKWVR